MAPRQLKTISKTVMAALLSLLFWTQAVISQQPAGCCEEVFRIVDRLRLEKWDRNAEQINALVESAIGSIPNGDHITTAAVYNSIGNIAVQKGYYQSAIKLYETGLATLSNSAVRKDGNARAALDQLR